MWSMVVLLAQCSILPEARDSAIAEMTKMLAPSRAEEGCISYTFYENPLIPNDFIFVEEWESGDAIKIHFATDFFKAFFDALGPLVAAPPAIKTCVVSEVHAL